MSHSPKASRRNVLRGAVLVGVGTAAGGGALLTSNLAHADVPAPEIASCAEWGARPDTGLTQLSNKPNKIVVHHTASANTGDMSKEHAHQFAYTVQGWHMNENGWADSGHNITISRGGYLMEGRHTSLQHITDGDGWVRSAHAPGANDDGIGIENEGTYTSETPTDELWNSLVAFCAYACQQFGFAATEIYGHRDYSATACPGDALYAKLPQLREEVQAVLDGGSGGDPVWEAVVDNADKALFVAGDGWELSSYSSDKNGPDYAFADPGTEDAFSVFSAEIPEAGTYEVATWYPANADYNPKTPYVVHGTDGDKAVTVDQTSKGGQWVSLGDYALAAGAQPVVSVGRKTDGAGYVIADAIRVKAKK